MLVLATEAVDVSLGLALNHPDDLGQLQVPFRPLGEQLVGRGSLIESVTDLVAKNDPPPEERRVTLYGVPGTGKVRFPHDYIKAQAILPRLLL